MTFVAVVLVLLSLFNVGVALKSATYSPWLNANFIFTWTPPGVQVSVPTTAQCDTINITWNPLNNGSPDPVPPYHLRVYVSTLTYPIIVDAGRFSPFRWTVPFLPDTQYQICMFDSLGRTGGCQDKYTVMPPKNSTHNCNANFTIPQMLSMNGVTEHGPLTQYGWPDQCTTISLEARNGTPPYNMSIAPSLHPPLNLTFKDQGPMNWTVTLGWGAQFWISVVDSLGASWAYGPLHSGGNGPTDCLHLAGSSLATQPQNKSSEAVSSRAAIGIAFGSLVFGIILTVFMQWIRSRIPSTSMRVHDTDGDGTRALNSTSVSSRIDPYPIESVRSQPISDGRPMSEAGANPNRSTEQNSQVYVVHHDAGGAPITIYTGGRDVQELPPHYSRTSSPELRQATSTTHLRHTPSTSMDSTTNTSSGVRRTKSSQPLRSITD